MIATAPPSAVPIIESKLIVPFVRSTTHVFSTMAGIKAEILKPHVKTTPVATYDVSRIIGFSGGILGTVVISFQLETAKKLVSAFAGMDIAPGTADFADAIGELANMVAGSAKSDLGVIANISLPSVIIGHGHTIARLSGVPCVVIPCRTAVGEFAVEVNIKTATH